MVSKYRVLSNDGLLALAFVSPNTVSEKHIIVSVLPIERTGKGWDSTFEGKNLISDLFPRNTAHDAAIRELLGRAGVGGSYVISEVS